MTFAGVTIFSRLRNNDGLTSGIRIFSFKPAWSITWLIAIDWRPPLADGYAQLYPHARYGFWIRRPGARWPYVGALRHNHLGELSFRTQKGVRVRESGRDVHWLWWPISVRLAFRNGRPRWKQRFTQHGIAHVNDFAIGGPIKVVQRCWNVGPLCIVFGSDARVNRMIGVPHHPNTRCVLGVPESSP